MSASVRRLTPLLVVDRIEPCLPFWVDRLGFTQTVALPEGDALGFVILEKDGVEVMYQSRASVAHDVPALTGMKGDGVALFIEVGDIEAVERALEGVERVIPRRRTFYGMDEIGVREPGGYAITFAQPVAG